MGDLNRFKFQLLDNDMLSQVRTTWDFQAIGDDNKPHCLLLERIEKDLGKKISPSCHAPVYYGVRDLGQGGAVVAINEMVFSTLSGEVLNVKQLDAHLCPFVRDKVLLEELPEAVDYAVLVYVSSIGHAFELNEAIRPNCLKLYARDKIQLEFFTKFASVFSRDPRFKSLKILIKGRWLEITGQLTEEKK